MAPKAAAVTQSLTLEIADGDGNYREKVALKTSDTGARCKVTAACVESLRYSANSAPGVRKPSIELTWGCPGTRSFKESFNIIEDAGSSDVLLKDATVEKILKLKANTDTAFPVVAKKEDKENKKLAGKTSDEKNRQRQLLERQNEKTDKSQSLKMSRENRPSMDSEVRGSFTGVRAPAAKPEL